MDKAIIGKKAAAEAAVKLIQEGMVVGLGSGSTSACFIEALSRRCRDGLKIQAVASSIPSQQLAENGKIPLVDINQLSRLDVTVDGADAVDPEKQMVKGGGGALLREKILAKMSKEMLVIIDESKLVPVLGQFPLPVEILPFGQLATIYHIESLGWTGRVRKKPDGLPFFTDNGNIIYDIYFNSPLTEPEPLERALKSIPGVIETGLFLKMAGRVIVGCNDGTIQIIN